MSLPHVIAIYSARPRMGKSTLGRALTNMLDAGFPLSFAAPIRKAEHEIMGYIYDDFPYGAQKDFIDQEWPKDKPLDGLGTTRREIQIAIGEGLRAHISPDFWCRIMRLSLFEHGDNAYPFAVIDDMRKVAEWEFLSQWPAGVTFVQIVGNTFEDSPAVVSEGELAHLSPHVNVSNQADPDWKYGCEAIRGYLIAKNLLAEPRTND